MRKLVICGLLLAVAVCAGVAGARPPGTNGMLTFARFNPTIGDTQVYVVNPDGSHDRPVQGPTDTGEVPRWPASESVDVLARTLPAKNNTPDDNTAVRTR